MTKVRTVYVLALFAGFCAAIISYTIPFFPYAYDSAFYIDQARSFLAKGIFEVTPFGTENADLISIPDRLFPPGFPLLMVISSILLPLSVEVIAPFLSLLALFILPTVVVFSFQRVLGLWTTLWIGSLISLTPATIRHGYLAYTDILSLALVIYAVNRLLTAGHKTSYWLWLGLLTGFSYLLRYANLSLLVSIFIYLTWIFIIEPKNRKQIFKNGLVWLGANALIVVPWLIRNFLVFGEFQPYQMEPSKVSLGENIHDYLKAQLDILLGLNDLDKILANHLWGLVLLVILVTIFIYQLMTTWHHWKKIEQQTFFIAVVYSVVGAAMVIAARTKYEWGIHIVDRYTLPYSFFIIVALIIIFKNSHLINIRNYLPLGLAMTLLIVRIWELPKLYEYNQYQQKILQAARHIKVNNDIICTPRDDRFAVSNMGYIYNIQCASSVRHVYAPFQETNFLDDYLKVWAEFGAKRGIVVSLFPYADYEKNQLPLLQESVKKLNALGWQIEHNDKENLILIHNATSH